MHHTLVAAKEAGVDEIYKVGGAQAIAALALRNRESIAKGRQDCWSRKYLCSTWLKKQYLVM